MKRKRKKEKEKGKSRRNYKHLAFHKETNTFHKNCCYFIGLARILYTHVEKHKEHICLLFEHVESTWQTIFFVVGTTQ